MTRDVLDSERDMRLPEQVTSEAIDLPEALEDHHKGQLLRRLATESSTIQSHRPCSCAHRTPSV